MEDTAGLERAIKQLIELGGRIAEPVETLDGRKLVIYPEGHRVQEIHPLDPPLPEGIRQTVEFADVTSFVEYVNTFKDDGTRLFASTGMVPRVLACLDYHRPGAPRRVLHTATLACALSLEWQRWVSNAPSNMTQAKFAAWIEENREDIVEPDAARVLEVVSELKLRRRVEFESAVNNTDGTTSLVYKEHNENVGSGKSIDVPDELKIGLPVFLLGDLYEARVFLRYRIDPDSKKLSFTLKVHRSEYILRDAFDALLNAIVGKTSLAVWHGKPERLESQR